MSVGTVCKRLASFDEPLNTSFQSGSTRFQLEIDIQCVKWNAIDLVDIDEANKEVRDRTISHDEWMGAVNDFSQ